MMVQAYQQRLMGNGFSKVQPITWEDFWGAYLPGVGPAERGTGNRWSPRVVEAFRLLLRRNLAGGGVFAALDANDLRASGWKG